MESPSVSPAKLSLFGMLRSLPRSLGQGWKFFRENGFKASLAAFNSRDAHPLIQFIKYGICGAGALILHVTVFSLCSKFLFSTAQTLPDQIRGNHSIINNIIAFAFSNTFVYWLNTLWVFTTGRHHRVKEFLIFTMVNAPGAIAGTAVMAYLTSQLGWSTPMAFMGFVLPNVLINFLCRKFFIFEK